jgi:hypothetical protein
MNNDTKTCSQCRQKSRCGQLYEKLGNAKGPNVAWKVIVAFLVPILTFILFLAGATTLLQEKLEGKTLTVVTFSMALIATLGVIILIRAVRRLAK